MHSYRGICFIKSKTGFYKRGKFENLLPFLLQSTTVKENGFDCIRKKVSVSQANTK